jgi:Flp pilus assembly protein TadB
MSVPLRDHLEGKADAEAKRVNLLFALAVAAVAFVWVEIQRRLGVLNHAHETAQEVAKTTVRQDMYDQGKREQDGRIEKVEKEQGNATASRTAYLAAIGAGAAIVTIVITLVVLLANGRI